ncbi:MAG: UDP-N-acetylmuramoyl-tripeptide--D-alanyl-D-alanine ligase [Clostridiales bacterium]|nr:UDP-N-acetylmuramoyl-tripeptide--D-alanyl-D-alanine ligase [Clostridiales bacterium]
MYQLNTEQLAHALGYAHRGAAVQAQRVVFDSREVLPGDLFVAIKGARVNGADYIDAAFERGAVAFVAAADIERSKASQIVAGDGLEFIQKLARLMRARFNGPVIAVTGSQGKTSSKDLLTHILSRQHQIVVTHENQNNELGLPLTLTRLTESTEMLVVEMGMSDFGEIAFLAEIARPTHALVTNIGIVHAEILGSQAGIAKAKTELFPYVSQNGTIAVRESDKPLLAPYLPEALADMLWTAMDGAPGDGGYWVEDLQLSTEYSDFVFCGRGEPFAVRLNYAGRHQVENALLVIATALALGESSETIRTALAEATPLSSNRMEKIAHGQGFILNDSYNANPASVKATLAILAGYTDRPRWACIGNMYELGPYETEGHRAVGQRFAQLGLEKLICVGELTKDTAKAALAAGVAAESVVTVNNSQEALAYLQAHLPSDAVLLVKGSHSMDMAAIVSGLV